MRVQPEFRHARGHPGAETQLKDCTMDTELSRILLPQWISQGELEACSRMAYRIAHDLGNLTAAVAGNAELICRGAVEGSPVRRRAGNILTASEQALALARHMVMFLGHASRDDQPLDASALLRGAELGALLQGLPRSTPVIVEPSDPANLPHPYASVARIRHCLETLLANASDALVDRPGHARLRAARVTLEASAFSALLHHPQMQPGDCLLLSVEDEGEGIHEKTLPHLFTPAYSTRLRQPGFGLSDVYGILCRQHGGAIGLWTRPGTGTRVNLYLPANRPRPAAL